MSYRLPLCIFSTLASLGIITSATAIAPGMVTERSRGMGQIIATSSLSDPENRPLLLAQASENVCTQGLELAQKANQAGKIATTAGQWTQISEQWQQAADFMAQVPAEDDCYAKAQERINFYRNNSEIALEEAEKSRTPRPFLVLGAQGEAVTQLQQQLKDLGHFQGEVDGIFAQTTQEAAIAFQNAQGLDADGQVGQNTWDNLDSALIAQASSKAESEENESEKDNKEQKPSQRQGIIGWVMMGLGGLTVLGGTVFILLKLLNRRVEEEDFEEEEDEEELDSMESGADSSAPELMPSLAQAALEKLRNGKSAHCDPETESQGLSEEQPEQVSPEKNAHPELEKEPISSEEESSESEKTDQLLPVNETTRLPKLAIVEDLIKDLESADPQKRRQAIWELGQRGNSLAVQPLLNLLFDSDSGQRTLILSALSEIGVKTIKPMNRALSLSLQDDNPDVRKNAIRDFTRMYELIATVSHMMCHAVDDPDEEVQEVAEWAVLQLRRISAASNMVQLKEKKSSNESDDFPDDDD
ncbi:MULTISPECIES: peptidoglycan-binding protein [unclassified Roseofilum]|uniref:peptidoglycan-binding protein n=1 Tax=unclassified Roseofilum TaxID=2620099 RepID=UPI001B0AA8E5|nr:MULTISPECIES: peptidoglycan-binding protein [unclassified Roseofilum]MBP0007697.1 peptidoglycan-binding protein [Roseofilum sp. Belize Diploria]MBP0031601.1 peptidoglycan-binding protein [Roseofilum sp. Belize BBD 4]